MVSGSNGGWNVTRAHRRRCPAPAPRKVLAMIPLFDGAQTTRDRRRRRFTSRSPAGTKTRAPRVPRHRARRRRRATPAASAPPRSSASARTRLRRRRRARGRYPWRTDCAKLCTHRALRRRRTAASTTASRTRAARSTACRRSRANWCPGALTPPLTWDAPALHEAGDHTFSSDHLRRRDRRRVADLGDLLRVRGVTERRHRLVFKRSKGGTRLAPSPAHEACQLGWSRPCGGSAAADGRASLARRRRRSRRASPRSTPDRRRRARPGARGPTRAARSRADPGDRRRRSHRAADEVVALDQIGRPGRRARRRDHRVELLRVHHRVDPVGAAHLVERVTKLPVRALVEVLGLGLLERILPE